VTSVAGLKLDADLKTEILFNDLPVIAAGAQSRWVRRRKIALADLVEEPWILPPPDSIPGLEIAEVFRACGLKQPAARVVSFSIPLHYHLVGSEGFVTILPKSLLQLGNAPPIRSLAIKLPPQPRPTGIAILKNRTLTPVAHLFMDCARETAKPLAQRNNRPAFGQRGPSLK
jgi:DNA-binding transcriptional LysR family regulator